VTLRARVDRYRLPLGSSVRTARATWAERSGCIVTLQSDNGEFGQGEAAPLPDYSDDSLEQAERELSKLDLTWLSSVLADAEELPSTLLPALAQASCTNAPSAHFALETAALDLLARRKKQPLHRWLRAAFPELPQGTPAPVALCALLGASNLLGDAEHALRSGFSSAKVKVGLPGREPQELVELTALRREFPSMGLRLDANGAWSSRVAAVRLSAFAALGVEFIEEPSAAGEAPLLDPPMPVALDESLRRAPLPARHELAQRGVVAVVLKPSVLGGILRSLALSLQAHALGCAFVLSHCFEGPIAFAALCELGLALGPARFSHGLGPHVALEAWHQKPRSLGRGELVPHDQPGLGLGPRPLAAATAK
jgi:o-succinylbenzoate synthase